MTCGMSEMLSQSGLFHTLSTCVVCAVWASGHAEERDEVVWKKEFTFALQKLLSWEKVHSFFRNAVLPRNHRKGALSHVSLNQNTPASLALFFSSLSSELYGSTGLGVRSWSPVSHEIGGRWFCHTSRSPNPCLAHVASWYSCFFFGLGRNKTVSNMFMFDNTKKLGTALHVCCDPNPQEAEVRGL